VRAERRFGDVGAEAGGIECGVCGGARCSSGWMFGEVRRGAGSCVVRNCARWLFRGRSDTVGWIADDFAERWVSNGQTELFKPRSNRFESPETVALSGGGVRAEMMFVEVVFSQIFIITRRADEGCAIVAVPNGWSKRFDPFEVIFFAADTYRARSWSAVVSCDDVDDRVV